MRELFLRSGYRDEVKYAMALMSGFGRPEDADLFRVVGRHEEFTVYAAVALATVTGDPLGEWLGLLPHVSGWGRTELAELILREPRSEDVRASSCVRARVRECARARARLPPRPAARARQTSMPNCSAGAREIIDSLVWDSDSPDALTDYEDAGPAVENLLLGLGEHRRGFSEFITAFEPQRMLRRTRTRGACGLRVGRRLARRAPVALGEADARHARSGRAG